MKKEKRPLRAFRLTARVILPFVAAGSILGFVAARIFISPLSSYILENTEKSLLHASALGLAICEENLDKLISLRLYEDENMASTMQKDALERIKQLTESFYRIDMLVIDDAGVLVASTFDISSDDELPVFSRKTGIVRRIVLADKPRLSHSRYFPLWRWHIVSSISEKDASTPTNLFTSLVFTVTFGMLLSLTLIFLIVFRGFVAIPLNKLMIASNTISAGTYESIPTLRNDEIGDVIRSFNEMVENLKRNKAAIEASLEEKDVLIKEIHHRVKNNLTIVASLLNLQSAAIVTPESAKHALESSKLRIYSMAKVHERLYESNTLSKIEMSEYARSVVNELYSVYSGDRTVDLELEIDTFTLDITQAVPSGLILNELVSNALIHGLHGCANPKLRVDFRLLDDANILLAVRDNGKGLPKDFDIQRTTSLGLNLVRILSQQVRGELSVESGTETLFQVIFPRRQGDSFF